MRKDAVGFFWDDTPPPKPPKAEKEKRTPPTATWLNADYLPGLEEARRFPVHVMSIPELMQANLDKEEFVFDVEVYANYFLCMFTSVKTGSVFYIEEIEGGPRMDTNLLGWILSTFQVIGFNSINYDSTMCYLAVAGCTTRQIKYASDRIIVEELRPSDVLKEFKVQPFNMNHIDLIEVAPLSGSLKTYGGRLHVKKLQDLPFHPSTILNDNQIICTRWYCVNDTVVTIALLEHLREHIGIRIKFGEQYKQDFRSKSDAQMAEEVIKAELKRVTGRFPRRPKRNEAVGKQFYYKPPAYIQFQTPELQQALYEMCNAQITVDAGGHAECPPSIRGRTVVIGGKPYTVGMGGLHSKEKSLASYGRYGVRIIDRDVTGYYPNLILKNGFAPPHLGREFLIALQGMVDRRTKAKRIMQAIEEAKGPFDHYYDEIKAEADGLKISNNGIFGKLSDPFSIVYDVPNMVQVTITGQLSLLMIIEMLELHGIPVVSANTDGIVTACPAHLYDHMNTLFAAWEQHTGLETEETEYKALYAANVNNYIAVKMDGKTKVKGWYSEKGSAHNSVLSKNPEALICSDAVQKYLANGTSIYKTIRECTDIRRFVALRVVNGGCVKLHADNHNEFLGKTARWYYSTNCPGELVYARSGNKVSKSGDNARPLMNLPDSIPDDMDYEYYEQRAERMLREVGAVAA